MPKKFVFRVQNIHLYAVAASVILSFWAIYVDNVINDDGTLYIRTAALISQNNWHGALSLFKWPLYPALISYTSQTTGLGLEHAAFLLNIVLTAVIVVCFIELVRELGGDNKIIVAAMLTILLYPGINEYRSEIIRDTGYVAFYLLSFLFLAKYVKQSNWKLIPGWAGALFMAALFRIEGFVFLGAMPIILQLRRIQDIRVRAGIGIAIAGFLVISMILGMGYWQYRQPVTDIDKLSIDTVAVLFKSGWQFLGSVTSERLDVIETQLLPKYSVDYAPIVLVTIIVIILAHSVISKLTLIFSILSLHAIHKKLFLSFPKTRVVWLSLALLNVAILSFIGTVRLFITSRWPLALSLTLLLAAPFSLAYLYSNWRKQRGAPLKKNWMFPAVCILLFLTAINGLTSFSSKTHIKEAGIWIRDKTPSQTTLLSNSQILVHYSGKQAFLNNYSWAHIIDVMKSNDISNYNYVAVRIRRNEGAREIEVRELLGLESAKTFKNTKGDKVLIFKLSAEPGNY